MKVSFLKLEKFVKDVVPQRPNGTFDPQDEFQHTLIKAYHDHQDNFHGWCLDTMDNWLKRRHHGDIFHLVEEKFKADLKLVWESKLTPEEWPLVALREWIFKFVETGSYGQSKPKTAYQRLVVQCYLAHPDHFRSKL